MLMGSLMLNSIPRPKENSIHLLKDSMTEKKILTLRERLMASLILMPRVNWIRTQKANLKRLYWDYWILRPKVKTTLRPMDLPKDSPRVRHLARNSVKPKGLRILIQKES